MHIAWIGKKSPPCGNVTYSREITNALLDRGYQVSFLHFAQEEAAEVPQYPTHYPKECQEVSLPFLYKSQVYTIPSLRSSKVLIQSLQELKPDLVHASLTLSPLDFALPEICQELNIPLVATFHPPFSKHRNLSSGTQQLTYQLYAQSLANYNAVIIFSQAQRDLLVKLGVPKDRIEIIPNGVDTDKYSPAPFSAFRSEIAAEKLFVYQGRIAIEKNVESLLKAWRQAVLPPSCKLVMVGEGPLMNVLMPSYGPEHNILWLGAVMDDQRRVDILRGADVFILPSYVEGLSLSLLEAMSCGVACLATDAGADGEVLDDGVGIVLNPSRVKSELKTLLPLMVTQPELLKILGEKSRQRVLDRYSLTRNLDHLEVFYQRILSKKVVSAV